jgi:hypothetical protein
MGTEPHLSDSLREVGQDAERVCDLARSERIEQLWDAETECARERGLFWLAEFRCLQ